jgi:hypothetical protein
MPADFAFQSGDYVNRGEGIVTAAATGHCPEKGHNMLFTLHYLLTGRSVCRVDNCVSKL